MSSSIYFINPRFLAEWKDRTKVIQGIEHNIKSFEKRYIEIRVFDIGVTRIKFNSRIKLLSNFLRDLLSLPTSRKVIPAPLIS
jgi:hypothetical protein